MAEDENTLDNVQSTKNDTVVEENSQQTVSSDALDSKSEVTESVANVENAGSETVNSEVSAESTSSKTESQKEGEEKLPTSVDELTKLLIEAKFKAEKHWETVLRQRAETENVRKRMERELEKVRQYALEKFAHALLPIKDSMELGLEAAKKPETDVQTVRDGLVLTLKMLTDVLQKFDIVEINPQDEKFDPQLHEAMTLQVVPTVPDNTVIYVHQKGYQLNKRLLRPARVVVSKLP